MQHQLQANLWIIFMGGGYLFCILFGFMERGGWHWVLGFFQVCGIAFVTYVEKQDKSGRRLLIFS